MKNALLVIVAIILMFFTITYFSRQSERNTTKKRLESATTYPAYMTAVYNEGGDTPFCGGVECEPRMDIAFGKYIDFKSPARFISRNYKKRLYFNRRI